MDLGLKGKKAVVTGGSRGIGRAIADLLADEGADVAICARNAEQVAAAVEALKAKGVNAWGQVVDIADGPALMGLLNVWYTNFLGAQSHAVLPYAQQLSRFPAYLQQLTMESNGKRVRWDGSPVTSDTGEIFWGEPGTNGQHAFYQLIHQGTRLIPADFIGFVNPAYPLTDDGRDVHGLFLANFLAQTKALAFGKTAEEVEAEGTTGPLVAARTFPGNRPTTSIFAPALTPRVLGELIALYEHLTFTQGVVWGINSFDQWGVELGKQLALQIAPAIEGDADAAAAQDASTRALLDYYRAHRA